MKMKLRTLIIIAALGVFSLSAQSPAPAPSAALPALMGFPRHRNYLKLSPPPPVETVRPRI